MSNPYKRQKDYAFWSRSMSSLHHHEIDPVTENHVIGLHDKVATMGSCFAQHLARFIMRSGANYFVAEEAPAHLSPEEAKAKQYGIFSARYGNVYTVCQANQLFDRAYGIFQPIEDVWQRGDSVVDAFRPQVEPLGFADVDALRTEREMHLRYVREVFEESDWLVLTLGLTEAWRSRQDGAVYPVAPGVAGGSFDPLLHEFVNFSALEISEQLTGFIDRLRKVNNRAKVILTVSPVPLVATYEDRHVWVSTTYSKAALRVAAEEAVKLRRNVIYFPSYEIITSPAAGGRYYADDLREVTDLGVTHVMRVFARHFLDRVTGSAPKTSAGAVRNAIINQSRVVCDEELIERTLAVGAR